MVYILKGLTLNVLKTMGLSILQIGQPQRLTLVRHVINTTLQGLVAEVEGLVSEYHFLLNALLLCPHVP